MKDRLKNNKKLCIAIVLLILLIVGGTYAWKIMSLNATKINKLSAESMENPVELIDDFGDGIHLEKQVPLTLRQGLETTPYVFKLKNNSTTAYEYSINIDDAYDDVTIPSAGIMDDSKIRYLIKKDGVMPLKGVLSSENVVINGIYADKVIYSGTYSPSENKFISMINKSDSSASATASAESLKNAVNNKIEADGTTDYIGAKDALGTFLTGFTFEYEPNKKESHLLSEGRSITTGIIEPGSEIEYTLYVWIDSRAQLEVANQIFSGIINVDGVQSEHLKYDLKGILVDSEDNPLPNTRVVALYNNKIISRVISDGNGNIELTSLVNSPSTKICIIPSDYDQSITIGEPLIPEGIDDNDKVNLTNLPINPPIIFPSSKKIVDTVTKKREKEKKTLKLGDYVKMKPVKKSFTTDTAMTGHSESQTINPQELDTWRVISINDDGTYDLVSEHVSSTKVIFNSRAGYINYIGYLNTLAKQYENPGYTIGSRHTGYNGQTEYLSGSLNVIPWNTVEKTKESNGMHEYNYGFAGDDGYVRDTTLIETAIDTLAATTPDGTDSDYYLASRNYVIDQCDRNYAQQTYIWGGKSISKVRGELRGTRLYNNICQVSYVHFPMFIEYASTGWYDGRTDYLNYIAYTAIRPIVTIKSDLGLTGYGTKAYPYKLSVK